MTAKPIIARERALGDIDAATDHYADEAGEAVALGFIDALESAYRLIAARPASGSLFHANALGIPGLRRWRLKRYPYLIFYLERDDHIDVWRVLHEQRDIPARMREPND
jgi:toxin ParE1/3/4